MRKKQATKKKTGVRTRKTAGKKSPETQETFRVLPGWINKKEMAASLGISVQAFDQWGIEPVARRHKYGEAFFTVEQVVRYKVRRALEVERERIEREFAKRLPAEVSDIVLEQQRADLELTQERAETQRLRNAQLRRELAPVDAIKWVLGQMAAKVGAILDPLPGKIRRRQPKLTNSDVEAIRRELVKAQNAAAEFEVDWDAYQFEPRGD